MYRCIVFKVATMLSFSSKSNLKFPFWLSVFAYLLPSLSFADFIPFNSFQESYFFHPQEKSSQANDEKSALNAPGSQTGSFFISYSPVPPVALMSRFENFLNGASAQDQTSVSSISTLSGEVINHYKRSSYLNPNFVFIEKTVSSGLEGASHVRYYATYRDYIILGMEVITHFDYQKNLIGINGEVKEFSEAMLRSIDMQLDRSLGAIDAAELINKIAVDLDQSDESIQILEKTRVLHDKSPFLFWKIRALNKKTQIPYIYIISDQSEPKILSKNMQIKF